MEDKPKERDNDRPLKKECRFYHKKVPDVGDVVAVQIKEVEAHGISVELLEYDKIEAMIIRSEYTSKRHNTENLNVLKQKKIDYVIVSKQDQKGKYFDLSKKGVDKTRRDEATTRYEKGKKLQNLFYNVCEAAKMDMEELYELAVWPFENTNADEHPYDLFQKAVFDFNGVFGKLKLPAKVAKALEDEIKKKLSPSEIKIKAVLELFCFTEEGIAHIKDALRLCKAEATEDVRLSVTYSAAPLYFLQVSSYNKQKARDVIFRCIKKVQEFMKDKGLFKAKDDAGKSDIKEILESEQVADSKENAEIITNAERSGDEIEFDDQEK